MMTAKEKADNLIEDFMHLFSVELENSIARSEARACAKLCVEEMIANEPEFPTMKRVINDDGDTMTWSEFWQEVKSELEKI